MILFKEDSTKMHSTNEVSMKNKCFVNFIQIPHLKILFRCESSEENKYKKPFYKSENVFIWKHFKFSFAEFKNSLRNARIVCTFL